MDENIHSSDTQHSSSVTSAPARTRSIHDVGMLDLLYLESADDLADVKRINDVGMILIHSSMQKALTGIELNDVGTIVSIPDDEKVNILSGQATLTGEALAMGDPDTTLVVAGQLFVTTPALAVGYKAIRVYGQLFAARGSEAAITPKIVHLSGQNFFTPINPRVFIGDTNLSEEFFQLLPEPQPLVIIGKLKLADDVTKESLKSKVPEIVLIGKMEVPERLMMLVEVLTQTKIGKINAY